MDGAGALALFYFFIFSSPPVFFWALPHIGGELGLERRGEEKSKPDFYPGTGNKSFLR